MMHLQRVEFAGKWSKYENNQQFGDSVIVITAIVWQPGRMRDCGCENILKDYVVDARVCLKMKPTDQSPDGFFDLYAAMIHVSSVEDAIAKTEEWAQQMYDRIVRSIISEFQTDILNESQAYENKLNPNDIDPCHN